VVDWLKMTRFLRYLGIAFSATCGIACVLLIVLWVRSYWWWDGMSDKNGLLCVSGSGRLLLHPGFLFVEDVPQQPNRRLVGEVRIAGYYFRMWSYPRNMLIPVERDMVIPHRLCTFVVATLAVSPWFPWSSRFSLRTLLIAIAMGFIMWAMA
jgi:hypothetical protein